MSSSRPEAPLPRDVNRGGWLLAIFWIEVGIQTIVVVLRLYVRRVLRNLGWDDWTMLAAHVWPSENLLYGYHFLMLS